MSKTAVAQDVDELDALVRARTADILRSNESLREQVTQLREQADTLQQRLMDAERSSQSDRQNRRAALNLMEDAVKARAAEQHENTERRRVEEELRSADRRKDQFLAILAHELRNPLAPIRNSVQILRMTAGDNNGAEQICEMLDRQVNHMVRLVDDLMEISRITRGKIELHKLQVEMAAVIHNAVDISKPAIDAARHKLEVVLPDDPVYVHADPVRLAQVFANLLNNAAKYTHEGGQIWLTVTCEGREAMVTVRDNGTGISTELLPRVFDLFIQGDTAHSRFPGGLGIGLTLVQRLIQLHGGSVEVSSQGTGQGSEFCVRLPLARSKPLELETAQDKTNGLATSRRILVVDDNRDAAKSLGMLLTLMGADVRIVHDGAAALEALNSYHPSVVLLDIGMPGMNGYEVASQARQRPEGKDVMVIALTGWGQEEDRRRSKAAGFDHHLVKPVDLAALEALLSSVP